MDTTVVAIIAIAVLLVLVVAFVAWRASRRRNLEHRRDQAAEHRRLAEVTELEAQRREAEAKLELLRAEEARGKATDLHREADELDPDVVDVRDRDDEVVGDEAFDPRSI